MLRLSWGCDNIKAKNIFILSKTGPLEILVRVAIAMRTGCAHKDFLRFCLTQNENNLGLKVVTTPTQPQHNLNLTQLSWV